ncbi:MAG TPA: alpha/beta hydrolase [Myxococcales bacterium]|nr:alpha/beta hydrolase [Myxococcales bacterium]
MDFRERDVPVRGLSLRARERGPDDAAITFLLHGWLDHRGSFDLLAPLLPGRTVAYDHRGHGDSAWVGAGAFYHFVDYLGDLDGLVREVAPEGPVRLVGHSMGGALSLLYAAARPDRVAHVTMLDAAPIFVAPDEVPERHAGWLDELAKTRERREISSVEDARDRLLRANPRLSPDAARLLAEGAVTLDLERIGMLVWKWDPLLRARSPLPYTQDVLQRMISAVRAPVLLLRAEHGHLPEERELRTRFASLPDLTIETVPGASHHLHLEQPGLVAERIQRAWG